jgi:hypothetical protein
MLLTTTYRDLNDWPAMEKRQDVEGLVPSGATVRRLRRTLGRPVKHRRRARQYRARHVKYFPKDGTPWNRRHS